MSGTDACSRLQEADAAFHRLSTGQAVALVRDQNGESVQYTAASRDGLLNYIRTLAAQCPTYTPTSLRTLATRPLRFWF